MIRWFLYFDIVDVCEIRLMVLDLLNLFRLDRFVSLEWFGRCGLEGVILILNMDKSNKRFSFFKVKRRGLSGDIFSMENIENIFNGFMSSIIMLLWSGVVLDIDLYLRWGFLMNVFIKFLYFFKRKILLVSL